MKLPTSPSLRQVFFAGTCSGCGLCAGEFPEKLTMEEDAFGYLRPTERAQLDKSQNDAFAAMCPGVRVEQTSKEGTDHILWGPIVSLHTGHATDEVLRYSASSGGVLSAVATHLLANHQIDGVVQVRASRASPIRNETTQSFTAADVFEAAGSRYAPSSPLSEVGRLLDQPKRFAFVGKPCDVAALRALQRRDPRARERFPYVLSFFCAGVPSTRGAKAILKQLGVEEAEVERFRYRGEGWPGTAAARTRDGRIARMSYTDSWGAILSKHVQFRCKICPDGTGGLADLVCADAWKSDERGYPLFEEQDGRSLVMARTSAGQALLDACVTAGAVALEPLEVAEIAKLQPSQARRKREVLARMSAMPFVGRRPPTYRGFNMLKAAATDQPMAIVKAFLGTLRRLILRMEDAKTRS